MPFLIRLFTENLAQRNLLSFPPGLGVERGDFTCNIARDVPKSNSKSYFCTVLLSYAFPRESTRLLTLSEISISNPTPRPRGDISYPGRPYDRPCRAPPRNAFPNPALHGKSRAAKPPFLPAGTQGRKRRFLRKHRARFFQSRILDRGGKLLTVGCHMIALVERGREMPFHIRVLAGNLAQVNLLAFPAGLGVERGDFSCNIARDV